MWAIPVIIYLMLASMLQRFLWKELLQTNPNKVARWQKDKTIWFMHVLLFICGALWPIFMLICCISDFMKRRSVK